MCRCVEHAARGVVEAVMMATFKGYLDRHMHSEGIEARCHVQADVKFKLA